MESVNRPCRVTLCVHCDTGEDLMLKNRSRFSNGVVHSFTGGKDEMVKLVKLGLYIGESMLLSRGGIVVLTGIQCPTDTW